MNSPTCPACSSRSVTLLEPTRPDRASGIGGNDVVFRAEHVEEWRGDVGQRDAASAEGELIVWGSKTRL